MYREGELVVYGSTGVCRVEGCETPELPGADRSRRYYRLQPLYRSDTIFIPVDSKAYLRPVISAAEADRIIDAMPMVPAEAYHSRSTIVLAEHYKSMLDSHDCRDLVAMVRSIYAKKQRAIEERRKFGSVDERFLRQGEEMLYGELAAALGIGMDAVPAYIDARLSPRKDAV